MIKAVLFVLLLGATSSLHLKQSIKKQPSEEVVKILTVYLSLTFLILVLGVLLILKIKLPSPVLPLEMLFEHMGRILLGT